MDKKNTDKFVVLDEYLDKIQGKNGSEQTVAVCPKCGSDRLVATKSEGYTVCLCLD